jgi:hypothetical protein
VRQLEAITGAFSGAVHFNSIISLNTVYDSALPLNFVRKQFPVRLEYAIRVNKSQYQTLDKFDLYLPEPCFSLDRFCYRMFKSNEI